jgi:hypothetical protein
MQLDYPQRRRGGFGGFLMGVLVAGAIAVGTQIGGGLPISIDPPAASNPPAARTVPTPVPVVPQSPPQAVPQPAAPIQVIPQGQPRYAATAEPVPTAISPEQQAKNAKSYALAVTPPTPWPTPVCDAAHPAYTTDPVRVMDEHGMPIGETQGWSCGSQQEAVAVAQKLAADLLAKHKAGAP